MYRYFVVYNGAAWMVKEGAFFESQGGLVDDWGKNWKPVWADSIEHARDKAALKWGKKNELSR